MVIQAIGTDSSVATCKVTAVLFIRQFFNIKIKKQMVGLKTIQTLRHTMTLAKEAEIQLTK